MSQKSVIMNSLSTDVAVLIGPDLSSIVGDVRVAASEAMTLIGSKFKILYMTPSTTDTIVRREVILKSDTMHYKVRYFSTPQEYIIRTVKSLKPKLIFVLSRNINMLFQLLREADIHKESQIIFLIDNLRYAHPSKIYSATGNLIEVFKCIPGRVYYNVLPIIGTYAIAVSRGCKEVLTMKRRVLVLPPCYVEIYPAENQIPTTILRVNAEYVNYVNKVLQFIKDAKSRGCTVVLHAKVFGPRSGVPSRLWYKNLGFYSFISLYVMAKHLSDVIFVTWDTTPQLLQFYSKLLGLSKLPTNIMHLPYVMQEHINELYKLVDIVCIPRIGWHGYGVTTSFIEAMYFGKPILTNSIVLENLGLMQLRHDGLVVEDDIYKWPKILERIFRGRVDLRALGAMNRKIYDRLFSISVRAERVKQIIDVLLD